MKAIRTTLAVLAVTSLSLICGSCGGGGTAGNGDDGDKTVINVTGSDTMVNLAQAWAETYAKVNPDVSIQVAGGGSGVGIAGLIDGFVDVASASRKMKDKEIQRAEQKNGHPPVETIVGLDALAVFVHKDSKLDSISVEQLSEIYGENGSIVNWSQLGPANEDCGSDEIMRISRQNNSGTYYYFRDAVVGKQREFKLGSMDLSGSKEVVETIKETPCAIGYSGMAYANEHVKMLSISKDGSDPVTPSKATAADGSYPIARPLLLYTSGEPTGALKDYLEWVLSPAGQKIVDEIGYVPINPTE